MKEIDKIFPEVHTQLLNEEQSGNRVQVYINSFSSDPNYIEDELKIEHQAADKMRSQIKMEKPERDEFAKKAETIQKAR